MSGVQEDAEAVEWQLLCDERSEFSSGSADFEELKPFGHHLEIGTRESLDEILASRHQLSSRFGDLPCATDVAAPIGNVRLQRRSQGNVGADRPRQTEIP